MNPQPYTYACASVMRAFCGTVTHRRMWKDVQKLTPRSEKRVAPPHPMFKVARIRRSDEPMQEQPMQQHITKKAWPYIALGTDSGKQMSARMGTVDGN